MVRLDKTILKGLQNMGESISGCETVRYSALARLLKPPQQWQRLVCDQ
jgi:hypothetical protein